ncbi:MAG: hypothetical protein U0263_37965 [Polyangiaceae bacterium]
MTGGKITIAAATCLLLSGVSLPEAQACSSLGFGPARAWPPHGSLDVSPATSIFVLGSAASNPKLSLTRGGQPVVLGLSEVSGFYPSTGKLFRVDLPDVLEPSTEYVLTGPANYGSPPGEDAGANVELTRFTTAASYDKTPGTAPVISSLKLWRVRYALDEIGSGNCVFAEYHSYAELEFEPAVIPHTTTAGMLYTLTIAPATGGSTSTLAFSGDAPFRGHDVSHDPYPSALASERFLELDPSREYCARLSARGDGDNARLPVESELVCAKVGEVCAPGALCSPSSGGDDGSSGCRIGRSGASAGAVLFFLCGAAMLLRRYGAARQDLTAEPRR